MRCRRDLDSNEINKIDLALTLRYLIKKTNLEQQVNLQKQKV